MSIDDLRGRGEAHAGIGELYHYAGAVKFMLAMGAISIDDLRGRGEVKFMLAMSIDDLLKFAQ